MSTIVIETKSCPNCGKPMAAGALAGLCPACLLAQGAGADTRANEKTGFVPPPIEELQRLFPQLQIVSLLGAGGMGAVYKARQPALDRLVALKILPTESSSGVNFAERFNREARALARLNHPNIVTVHEFGQAGAAAATTAMYYFIMEFVDGANLRQLEQAGRLSPREALQIIPQICDALQYAHDEGVVHRDIKPENVLMDRKGRVKIADFGLARILGSDSSAQRLTMEGQVMGTPHYMAPEQVERPLAVDHRADIYALGVVFYEMLTGDLPLGKFPPPSRKVEVDVRLDDVVLRALENDPARRYQKASEVKAQVETIAGTPPPPVHPAAPAAPNESQLRWMNFPLVVERDGKRHVHKKGVLKAFAVIFGASTLAFLLVSLTTGRTLFGWLGISGSLSLRVRLVMSVILVGWGIWRAWHRPISRIPPQTPKGTVVLPPAGVSRKALAGAVWAPTFFLTALLMFIAVPARVGDVTSQSLQWWQILLNVTLLPLGIAAPFGTTILGWLAVGDIRRAQGRITGLPLAVFDGLFFPLLALNALLVWIWTRSVQAVAEGTGNQGFTGPWPAILSIGAAVICLVATFDVTRRVWRALKRDSPQKPPSTAKRVVIGLSAFVVIAAGVTIALITTVNWERRRAAATLPARHVVAEFDSKAGALVAKLPQRGTISLIAIADAGAPENAWWRPDGVAIPDTLFDVRAPQSDLNARYKHRDLIVRWRDLPDDASGPTLRIDSSLGGSTSSGEMFRDGKRLSNARRVRTGFAPDSKTATVWIGFGVGLWQTISTHNANGTSSMHTMLPDVPTLQSSIHQISEEGGQTAVTMLLERETRDWNVRVVAADTNGIEHTFESGTASGLEKASLWTYKFKLPRAQLKEFRVQLRPVQWAEFRDVPLEPKNRAQLGNSKRPFNPTRFGGVTEVEVIELFDFDKGRAGVFPTASDGTKSYRGIERNTSWSRSRGYDVDAGTSELRLLQTVVTDVTNADWDTLTPLEVEERLNHGLYAPPRLPSTPDAKLPVAYAFRTNDGGVGLMQILALAENGTGAKLRYKMIERAHFE